MTNRQFLREVLLRLIRLKWIIFACGLFGAVLMFFVARSVAPQYTAKATVFPLNASADNAGAASALTNLLGLAETPKSFVQEASINIVDLALSRNTRESVAMTPLPSKNNKLIADLVIEEYNKHKRFYQPKINHPKGPEKNKQLAAVGGSLLNDRFFAKINKNGILEINCTSTDPELAGAIAYVFVDKISAFYKELKIKKAKWDYDFVSGKVDSLEQEIRNVDGGSVSYSKKMLFVPDDKLEFQLPKQNNSMEKSRIVRQRDLSIDNKEEALWRLQKVTPIIEMLDKPDPPFETNQPSKLLYGIIGLITGTLLFSMIALSGIFFSYLNAGIRKLIS